MRQQFGEGGKRKKRLISSETGSQEPEPRDVLIDDEIDPADFFDPEEFGVRRKIEPLRP